MTGDAPDSDLHVLQHGSTEDALWHGVPLHECSTAIHDKAEFKLSPRDLTVLPVCDTAANMQGSRLLTGVSVLAT